jgi:hypothetical protein
VIRRSPRIATLLAAGTVVAAGALLALPAAGMASAAGSTSPHAAGYRAGVILDGTDLHHAVNGGTEALTNPDDISRLGDRLFVAFQNGVGSTGGPSSSGNTASTVVEFTTAGRVLNQWDVTGKVDGLTADPQTRTVAATVNEDGNSSLYVIDPAASSGRITHYVYNLNPLPHGGGTDAVTFMDGLMLISASAPTNPSGPAVYVAFLRHPVSAGSDGLAILSPLFYDNSAAAPADPGAVSPLALTDPDSNEAVPASAPRFGGDFLLDSQGDQEQIYVAHPGTANQSLSVLAISQSVDDTAFSTGHGVLYATDPTHDLVDAVTGVFRAGEVFTTATPCGANSAPPTCPAPNFPANYLATLDLTSGTVSPLPVSGAALIPEGLLFVGGHHGQGNSQRSGQ